MTFLPRLTRRFTVFALGAVLAAPALPVLTRTALAQTSEPVVVRIGFASLGVDNRQFAGGSTSAIAHAEGYLEQEFANDPHVSFEWHFFKGAGPAVNEAIANNQLDFAHHGDLPSLVGRANGLRTKILAITRAHTRTYLAVPAGSEITGIEDLRGKRVAFHIGTNLQLSIAKILEDHGLTDRDIRVVNMPTAASNAALAAGEIDAAFAAAR